MLDKFNKEDRLTDLSLSILKFQKLQNFSEERVPFFFNFFRSNVSGFCNVHI